MARLEGYKCPKHGDVFAKDSRWGPCPKCEDEAVAHKIDMAQKRIEKAKLDDAQVLRIEVAALRACLFRMGMDPVKYWEELATRLEHERDEATRYPRKP